MLFDGRAQYISGTYDTLRVTGNMVLDGDLQVNTVLRVLPGGTLNVRGYRLVVGQGILVEGGRFLMRANTAEVDACSFNVTSGPNATDSTLMSGGTLRITTGYLPLASGEHRLILDNHPPRQFCSSGGTYSQGTALGRIQHLHVNDTTPYRNYYFGMATVKGNLELHSGDFFSGAEVWGTVRSAPGTTIQGHLRTRGAIDIAGYFQGSISFQQGAPVVIPTTPNYNYHQVIIEKNTDARVTGTLNMLHSLVINDSSSINIGRDTVRVTAGNVIISNQGARVIMQHPAGVFQAYGFDGPTHTDSTLLSAGRMRSMGMAVSSNLGNLRTSGTHTLEIAGNQTFYVANLQNLEITNGATATVQGGGAGIVKGTLRVRSGALGGAPVISKGTLRIDAGAGFTAALRLEGALVNNGTFSPTSLVFAQGGSFGIPAAPNFNYSQLRISNNTLVYPLGSTTVGADMIVDAGSELDIRRRSLDVAGALTINGRLRMQETGGVLEAGTITLNGLSSNPGDSTLLSAGVLRLTGAGYAGNLLRSVGTFKLVMAGTAPQSFSAYSIPFVQIDNPTTTTAYQMTVKNNVIVNAGTLSSNSMEVRGRLITSAGTTVNGSQLILYGPLQAVGTFSPDETRLRQGGTFVLPSSANYQYKNIFVENNTALQLGGNISVNGALSLDHVAGTSLDINRYTATLTGGVFARAGGVRMQHGNGILDAAFVHMQGGAPNDLDASLISAGKIYLRAGNGMNSITKTSGTHLIVAAGTAAQSLHGTSLQNVWFSNPTTMYTGIGEVKGTASLRAGTWSTSSSMTVGHLQLLRNTTLNSPNGPITYGTIDDRGATIQGSPPVPAGS